LISLFIFIIGCFVTSLVAVGLLFALAAVGDGDEYESDSSPSSGQAQKFARRILRPETGTPEDLR
jgi:hypothetical protein